MRTMTILDYQDFVESMRTFTGTQKEELIWAVTGLNSEAGEVAGEIEKLQRKQEEIDDRRDMVLDELGDVLWYVAAICNVLSVDLEDVIASNITKLEERHG